MRTISICFLCLLATSLLAATQLRSPERLCELAVIPKFDLTYKFGFTYRGGQGVFDYGEDPVAQIAEARKDVKRQPDDITRWLVLGDLLDGAGQTNEADLTYQQAERMCRQRLEASPQSGVLLVRLSQALAGRNKLDEAENCCRQAVKVSPKEWRCWTGLGGILFSQSWRTLMPEKNPMSLLASGGGPVEEVLKKPPTAAALQKVMALNREAAQCYDQAVALAPREPDAFMQRANFKMIAFLENLFVQYFRDGSTFDTKKPLSYYLFTKNAVPDLKEAVRLSPRNSDVIGLTACFEWLTASVSAAPAEPTLEELPTDTRRSILDAITRLENLSQDADAKTASSAFRHLGFIKVMCGTMEEASFHAAEPCFRRAVALNPSDEASWNLLLASVLISGGTPEEMTAVCEARLKAANTVFNHLLLAKACTRQKNWDRAAREAGVAFTMDTNSIVAPLMLASLSIRQGEKSERLSQAAPYLRAARERIQVLPANKERDQRLVELMLNAALFQALSGKINEARELVDSVLKHDPENESAQQIKQALPDA